MKRLLKWLGYLLIVLILAIIIVPFVIPVRPLAGLVAVRDLAGPNSQFVSLPFPGTDGIELHFVEAGDSSSDQAFILIHGSVFNASTWDQVMDDFATRGRTIAYDRAPYGLSEKVLPADWTGAPPLSPKAGVARLFQLMDALGIERAVLVGNSYGAVVAVRAAALQPDRITGLVLGDAAVYVNESMPGWVMGLPQVKRLGPLLARGIGSSEAFVNATWRDPDVMGADRMAKTLIHTRAENWDSAFWSYLRTWETPDLAPLIAAIDVPTLVISGDSDTVVPLEDSQRLHAAIDGATLTVLPDCGHVPQEECPEAFVRAVTDWIDSAL